MKHIAIIAALAAASPVAADYSGHHGVTLFTEDPCTRAIGAIDGPMENIRAIAQHGMAWGFILGFDTALGGLEGDAETTLKRLRVACAADPEAPAYDLLRGFASPEGE